jgi:hypothetical protein
MLGLISVETGLDEIKAHLQTSGYTVVDMSEAGRAVEAVIFTGQPCGSNQVNSNSCSCQELYTVLINATGLTPVEVAEQLAIRLGERNIQELSGY